MYWLNDLNLGVRSLDLSPEEQERVATFDREIAAAQARRTALLREIAKAKQLCAPDLTGLKSASGKPFEETTPRGSCRTAIVRGKTLLIGSVILEMAYLCHDRYAGADQDGCGWVKGKPVERKYNDIGPLSGSAGRRYFCGICGKKVGELATRRS